MWWVTSGVIGDRWPKKPLREWHWSQYDISVTGFGLLDSGTGSDWAGPNGSGSGFSGSSGVGPSGSDYACSSYSITGFTGDTGKHRIHGGNRNFRIHRGCSTYSFPLWLLYVTGLLCRAYPKPTKRKGCRSGIAMATFTLKAWMGAGLLSVWGGPRWSNSLWRGLHIWTINRLWGCSFQNKLSPSWLQVKHNQPSLGVQAVEHNQPLTDEYNNIIFTGCQT